MRLSEAIKILAGICLSDLEIDILEQVIRSNLHPGLKQKNKNRFIIYDKYMVVELTREHWMLTDDSEEVRRILKSYCFCYHHSGYAQATAGFFHRLLLNPPEELEVDHRNRNKTDNRLENLRTVTRSENMKNTSRYKNNKTGAKGVCYRSSLGGYEARIYQDGIRKSKFFSCKKYGEEARSLAIAWRRQKEQELGYCGE